MHYTLSRGLALLAIAAPVAFALDSADDFFHGIPRHSRHHRRGRVESSSPIWSLTDSYQGKDFFDCFTFEAIADPTHGRVNYVDMNTAIAHNLTQATRDSFIMRADSTNVLDPSGPGRESIRLQSKKQWTTAVSVFNLNHMPVGCGTWPAYWMTQHVGWPKNGEIDVLEGVNDQIPNRSALHTIDGCTIAPSRPMTGTVVSTNCSHSHNYNEGCAVTWDRQDSYAKPLNAIGGGWFVTERTDARISIWFWGRHDTNVPASVKYGSGTICTKDFGTPVAVWESSSTCDFPTVFGEHNIIINLTLYYVNNNPAAFKDAYWDIASLKVYSERGLF
ncbi:hypothetical protein FRC10_012088 [Ceratobasidium sp. 414]|nr:hypothetical protein FRC10_012088 [Ceratobasidium sp. 414]